MRNPSDAATVCQLVHGLPVGGAEMLVSRIVRSLSDRYRFVIACLDELGELGESLVEDGVEIACLNRRPGFDWKCVRKLARMLADKGVDLVHAHQYTPFTYGLATRFVGRRPPILLTEHGRFFPDYPSRKRKIFNRLMTRSRDRFVAVGNSVRQALVDNEGLRANRIEVVYNGVQVAALKPGAEERRAVRTQLGIADGDFVVLHVARLDPIKDQQTAVRVVEIAGRRNPAVRMLIAGDGPERQAIERTIRQQHLDCRIKLLGMRDDVAQLLIAADAFLLTSVSEGMPVTVLEAMSAGVPVVATNVGGLPEIIVDGKTGLLAPVGDADRLADALLLLAENSELRCEIATRARSRLESHFSEDKMIAAYDRIYAEMMALTKPASLPPRADASTARMEPIPPGVVRKAGSSSSRLARR